MLDIARSGAWLTRARVRGYCCILLIGYILTVVALIASSNGKLDRMNRPLGADFSEVYAAGVSVLRGEPAIPYDNAAHYQTQKEIFGARTPFYAWSYPPSFLAFAAVLALLPYLAALALYQAASFWLCFSAVRRIAPHAGWLLPVLAFPGAYVNLINGQNAFLTAGLFAWSLILLDRRPVLAGVLIGLLAYKPQFGVLLPIALLAGGYWRVIASASVTVAATTAATWIGFGGAAWRSFFSSASFARVVMTEQGNTGFYKIQTVFSAVRQLGGPVDLAYGAQLLAALVCVAVVVALWLRCADWRLKSAALMVGALLSTPYALDYDLMLLGPALAFAASYVRERGPRDWEITALAFVWAAPVLARPFAFATHISLGAAAAVLFMAMIWRAASEPKTLGLAETAPVPA